MDRRTFLIQSAWITAGGLLMASSPTLAGVAEQAKKGWLKFDSEFYKRFFQPDSKYRPFVRWWWNGDKVETGELVRELRLLKEAGIGGVEINPISFPSTADDLGKKSLTWLSDEWIDMLKVTFAEAKELDMTCDLIVGSGWPFGAERLRGEECAQVALVYAENVEGPTTFEVSNFHIFRQTDPGVTDPNPRRQFEILSLTLSPDPIGGLSEAKDFSDQCKNETIRIPVPEGKHVFYAVVRVNAFAEVINGAPGAAGTILNHMNKEAVRSYLDHMSNTIEAKTGPLSQYLRAFFTDSMELEGSNWTTDMAQEFQRRRGYDLMPYFPFILFKVGRLGAIVDDKYGAVKSEQFAEELSRVRFDFELTKAELLYERFTLTYLEWCRDQGVQSRAQAYGRGFFPLETSLGYDIPEGESWTMNWLKHRLGEEMGDEDYRRGRGYTMINKYVASAAHLTGKRVVSAEEMTNTYTVFNETPEFLKLGSDMSIISGITHSIWHGFNYSPPEAGFPGWVQYGSYLNEQNNMWPHFHFLNTYKARVSSQLQHADMYTDMIILPANYDMWGDMGVQTDPFPEKLNVPYTSLLWEAIHKNGGGVDYTTEIILGKSTVEKGKLCYGKKAYGVLFLPAVKSLGVETMEKIHDFVVSGGRVFCIETFPYKSVGLKDYQQRDSRVRELVDQLKENYPDRFMLLERPEGDRFLEWYQQKAKTHQLPCYIHIERPDRYLMQNRYRRDDQSEFFFFVNAHLHDHQSTRIVFSKEVTQGRYPWVWDADTGLKYRIEVGSDGGYQLEMGPAESRLIIFDKHKKGEMWAPLPISGANSHPLEDWHIELQHSREGWSRQMQSTGPIQDLKGTQYETFTGKMIYTTQIEKGTAEQILNLGKVWGTVQLFVNGQDLGTRWFGNRIYDLTPALQPGMNKVEIHLTTTMGNYMATQQDKVSARFAAGSKKQPVQSMGILGPVTLYQPQKRG